MEKFKIKVLDFFGTIAMRLMLALDDIRDTIITIVITVVVCLVLTNFFFMPVRVEGTSMYPTLSDESFGFTSIISRRVDGIERFDIVVIHLEDENENLVKRVIGLPGETLWYINGTLYIDGEPIEEDFLDDEYVQQQLEETLAPYFTSDVTSITLGEDEYYCLGDNRLVSLDSRYYGTFSSDQIVSVGIFIIWPFSDLGFAQ